MISILRDNIYFRAHHSHLYICFPSVLYAFLTSYQRIAQYCDFGKLFLALYQKILCHKQTFSSYLSTLFLFIYDSHEQQRVQHRLLWDSTSNLHVLWKLIIHFCPLLLISKSVNNPSKSNSLYHVYFLLRVSFKGYCEQFC